MKFSQRQGLVPTASIIQTTGMNDALRNSLWNVLDLTIWSRDGFLYNRYGGGSSGEMYEFSRNLWFHYFKQPLDTLPDSSYDTLKRIRKYFYECQWFEVYDFIEFVLLREKNPKTIGAINEMLERELAGFRFISNSFVPITDEQEVTSVNQALNEGPFKGVTAHLRQAIDHLSRKQNPDYRNSIKESISAVESLAREITGNPKATLGDALTEIEKTGHIHPALKKGLSAIYGYTSDEAGIRHSMLEEPALTASDAKFFLVSCASFINYLKAKLE